MKKFLFSMFLLLFALVQFSPPAQSQTTVYMSSATSPYYVDTITNAASGYYVANLSKTYRGYNYGSFNIYVDHLTGSTDSTYVTIQGSIDGVSYNDLGSATYSATIPYTDPATDAYKIVRFGTADAGYCWNIQTRLTLPYYRFKVTHYATGTIRVKAFMYLRN